MFELGELKAPFSCLSSHQPFFTPKPSVGIFGREMGSFPEKKRDVEILQAPSSNRINSRTICSKNTDIMKGFKWIICFESWRLVEQVTGTASSHCVRTLNNNLASSITCSYLHDTRLFFPEIFCFLNIEFCIYYFANKMLQLRKISLAMPVFQTRKCFLWCKIKSKPTF